MAIRKRKWKTAQGVQTAWSYVFDAPRFHPQQP